MYNLLKNNYYITLIPIYLVPLLFTFILFNINTSILFLLYSVIVIISSILVSSIITRKYHFEDKFFSIKRFYYSFIISIGLIANILFFDRDLQQFKIIVIIALITSFLFEILWLKLFIKPKLIKIKKNVSGSENFTLRGLFFVTGIYLLSFFELIKFEYNFLSFNSIYLIPGIFVLLLIAVRLTFNFSVKVAGNNYWEYIWKHLKSFLLFLSLLFFFLSFFDFNKVLMKQMLISSTKYISISFLFFTFYHFWKKNINNYDTVRFKFRKATSIDYNEIEKKFLNEMDVKYRINGEFYDKDILKGMLQKVYLKDYPEFVDRFDEQIELGSIDGNRIKILRSRDEYNVDVIEDEYLQLFVNLHRINDIRRINQYFIKVNQKLKQGGIFVLYLEPLESRHKKFIEKYPNILAKIFYFIDFIWHRVIPKLPVLQKIYFSITDGNNRAISFAETLGRLKYCGFDIIDVYNNNGQLFITAIKNSRPMDLIPSYGPFFKMKRIGKAGKPIYVYKMRTMHPFSEFIQDLAYKFNKLDIGGKFKDDFRITSWGKFLRFFWLDELPMLINFLKGDIKLVGVRPISQHYLNLYPDDVRGLRLKTKPGLIPPFYYDLPKTFEEIVESERKYLESYFKKPFATDLKYLIKAMYNIFLKGARSK